MTSAENERRKNRIWSSTEVEHWRMLAATTRAITRAVRAQASLALITGSALGSKRRATTERPLTKREQSRAVELQAAWEARERYWLAFVRALARSNASLIGRWRHCPDRRCRRQRQCVGPYCVGDRRAERARTRRRSRQRPSPGNAVNGVSS